LASYVYRCIIGKQCVQSQDELVGDISEKIPNFEWPPPPVSELEKLTSGWERLPQIPFAVSKVDSAVFRSSGGDV
jgi:hypothetical protein